MSYGFTFLFKFCMFQVRINAFVENWQFFPLLLEHKYYSQFSIIEFICRGHLFVKGFSFEWREASALIGGEGIKNMESFNLKGFYYSYAWSCSLYERKTSFCTGLISRKLRILTYVFIWLYFTQYLFSFSSIDHLLRRYTRFLILFYLT